MFYLIRTCFTGPKGWLNQLRGTVRRDSPAHLLYTTTLPNAIAERYLYGSPPVAERKRVDAENSRAGTDAWYTHWYTSGVRLLCRSEPERGGGHAEGVPVEGGGSRPPDQRAVQCVQKGGPPSAHNLPNPLLSLSRVPCILHTFTP
eukprot:4968608-Pyramimonas_sp.AAC.2